MSGRFSVDGIRLGLGAAVALVVFLAVASPVQASDVVVQSTFDEGSEGWKVVGDVRGSSEKPTHYGDGGRPGGYISIEDDVLGGTMYWRAPKEIRSKMARAFEGSLAFSLRQHSAMERPYDADDVVLEGGGVTLVYGTSFNPSGIWGTYTVPLTNEGWINKATEAPATAEEMKAALKSLSGLAIRAEYEAGEDIDDLDTVVVRGTSNENFCRIQKVKLQLQKAKIAKLKRLMAEVDDRETGIRLDKKLRKVEKKVDLLREVIEELC